MLKHALHSLACCKQDTSASATDSSRSRAIWTQLQDTVCLSVDAPVHRHMVLPSILPQERKGSSLHSHRMALHKELSRTSAQKSSRPVWTSGVRTSHPRRTLFSEVFRRLLLTPSCSCLVFLWMTGLPDVHVRQ